MTAILDRAKLPNDPEILKDMLLEYARKVTERDERLTKIEVELRRFRRWQFGQKSERVPEGQLIFVWHGTVVRNEKPAKPERLPEVRPRPARGGYRVIPRDIPREVVVQDLPAEEKRCPDCRGERTLIGYEETKQLDYSPASFFERIFRRAKYACKPCGKHVATAPFQGPVGPFERGLPGFGLIAQIIVAKFSDHIPLYRQGRIYGRHGVEIPRQTLCDWVGQTIPSLEPIALAIKNDILLSKIIKTDDTVSRLLVRGLRRTAQARLWGYLGDQDHNQVFYEFTSDRKQEHPLRFFADYKGKIQADAYSGYDKLFLPGLEREELGCWAHARRHIYDARDTDPERAGTALGFIRMLYEIERTLGALGPRERAAQRREKSVPILRDFRLWLDREALRLLPRSPMAQALGYVIAQWQALTRFVDVGEASIDNNAMEARLRGPVLGRRNYLFVGSEAGGHWAAVCYTLIESCRLNGVEPYRYLKDVLRRVWTHPQRLIGELMPRLWKPPPLTA